jgi:hypothetical protein
LIPKFHEEVNEQWLQTLKAVWQQLSECSGASSHTDQKAQKWRKKNLNFFILKERWPPNSPELNPLDYSIWDNISSNMAYHKLKTINDLCRGIEKTIKKVDINYVRDVISVFRRRVYVQ